MLLTIDVGNTNTVLGIFDGDEVVEHWRIATVPDRTADELAVILQGLLAQSTLAQEPDVTGIALCSTVPSVLHEMREMFAPLLRRRASRHRGARREDRSAGADGQSRRRSAATGS